MSQVRGAQKILDGVTITAGTKSYSNVVNLGERQFLVLMLQNIDVTNDVQFTVEVAGAPLSAGRNNIPDVNSLDWYPLFTPDNQKTIIPVIAASRGAVDLSPFAAAYVRLEVEAISGTAVVNAWAQSTG